MKLKCQDFDPALDGCEVSIVADHGERLTIQLAETRDERASGSRLVVPRAWLPDAPAQAPVAIPLQTLAAPDAPKPALGKIAKKFDTSDDK